MGYLYQSQCFPTFLAATDAYWSHAPVSVLSGPTSYMDMILWSPALGWVLNKYTIYSGGTSQWKSSTSLPVLTFSSCDQSVTYFDGMQLGWGVAAAMVAAFGVKFMARALHR